MATHRRIPDDGDDQEPNRKVVLKQSEEDQDSIHTQLHEQLVMSAESLREYGLRGALDTQKVINQPVG